MVYSVLRLQAFFWILEPWGWDRQVVLQRPYKITITCCIITQKSAVLNYLTSSQHTLITPCFFNMLYASTIHVCMSSNTRCFTASAVCPPRYLGDTNFIISFRKQNFPTSAWKPTPQCFIHVSSNCKATLLSITLIHCSTILHIVKHNANERAPKPKFLNHWAMAQYQALAIQTYFINISIEITFCHKTSQQLEFH